MKDKIKTIIIEGKLTHEAHVSHCSDLMEWSDYPPRMYGG